MKTNGQVAYEVWNSLVFQPIPITWQEMPTASKAAWEEIAEEVINNDLQLRTNRKST